MVIGSRYRVGRVTAGSEFSGALYASSKDVLACPDDTTHRCYYWFLFVGKHIYQAHKCSLSAYRSALVQGLCKLGGIR